MGGGQSGMYLPDECQCDDPFALMICRVHVKLNPGFGFDVQEWWWLLHGLSAVLELARPERRHPVQGVWKDGVDVVRFKQNRIVVDLYQAARAAPQALDMNRIVSDWPRRYEREDLEQLAQLLGYSLSGMAVLEYVSDETLELAGAEARRRGLL